MGAFYTGRKPVVMEDSVQSRNVAAGTMFKAKGLWNPKFSLNRGQCQDTNSAKVPQVHGQPCIDYSLTLRDDFQTIHPGLWVTVHTMLAQGAAWTPPSNSGPTIDHLALLG